MHLELSISPCPNDTFMFDALLGGRIDCEGLTFAPAFHDIEELNRALRDAAPGAGPDMSKVSCALLPEIADRYEVLDSGAALGRGNGPLLVRRRGDRTPLRHVAVPGLHTTANALLRLLHPEIMERTPVLFSEIAAAVERGDYDAGVLIHEGRFVFGDRNLERVADLGEEWEARTGLPLPLGAIVVRRTVRRGAAPQHRVRFRPPRGLAALRPGPCPGAGRRRDRRPHRTLRERILALARCGRTPRPRNPRPRRSRNTRNAGRIRRRTAAPRLLYIGPAHRALHTPACGRCGSRVRPAPRRSARNAKSPPHERFFPHEAWICRIFRIFIVGNTPQRECRAKNL